MAQTLFPFTNAATQAEYTSAPATYPLGTLQLFVSPMPSASICFARQITVNPVTGPGTIGAGGGGGNYVY